MSDKKSKYLTFQDILNFLSFDYNFKNNKDYPFNKDPKNVIFSWGQVLIPKKGIRETVQNKISDIKDQPLSEITMMYQIPFFVQNKINSKDFRDYGTGIINQNITLGFNYGKEWKYGDITKSIYEVCFYILEHSIETNDFFIINEDYVHDFFSYYIVPNQWGLGSMKCFSGCKERYYGSRPNSDSKYAKLYRCSFCEFVVDPVDGCCPECGTRIREYEEDNKEEK